MSLVTLDQRMDTLHLHLSGLTQAVQQATTQLQVLLAQTPVDVDRCHALLAALQNVNVRAQQYGLGKSLAGILYEEASHDRG